MTERTGQHINLNTLHIQQFVLTGEEKTIRVSWVAEGLINIS